MAKVFVSHATADVELAERIHEWLRDLGYEVFRAHSALDGIPLGHEWEQRLHDELRGADAVVCLVTSAFMASRWCTAEVAVARSRGCRLLPVVAERGLRDPLLAAVQYVDMTLDPDSVPTFLGEALRSASESWPDELSPFPGLASFDAERQQVFFGRGIEVGQLANLVRSPGERGVIVTVGPSGCGKSSVVRAGLMPLLASDHDWLVTPAILPGSDPIGALTRELAVLGRQYGLMWSAPWVRESLAACGLAGLADQLLVASGGRHRLLVVIDQFEEVFTQAGPSEREHLASVFRPALAGPVRLLVTLRPEFLNEMMVDQSLARLPTKIFPVRPLGHEALRNVIVRPAEAAGIGISSDLVDRLVEDTADGEALPLLAFTLARLADGVTRGGHLSDTRYENLGGVQGALSHQADAALAEAVAASGRTASQVVGDLLRLTTVDEQGRPTRWRVNRADIGAPVLTGLDAFVARRLLTTADDNGQVMMSVTHESLLSEWPPLAQAIIDAASGLRARRGVELAAAEWDATGRPSHRLWGGGHLAATLVDTGARLVGSRFMWLHAGRAVLVTERVELSPHAHEFLAAGLRRDRWRRRRTVTVLAILLTMALISAGTAFIQQVRAEEGERVARQQQSDATVSSLLAQAVADRTTDPITALRLNIAAYGISPSGTTRAGLIDSVVETNFAHRLDVSTALTATAVASRTGANLLALVGSDRQDLGPGLASEGTVSLWNVDDPVRPRPTVDALSNVPANPSALEFAADGGTLAVGGYDGDVRLWDVSDPSRPLATTAFTAKEPVYSMAFSPDGTKLATGHVNGTVSVWDLGDTLQSRPDIHFTAHQVGPAGLGFSSDGRRLFTGGVGPAVALWDMTNVSSPVSVETELGVGAGINGVASSTGTTLVAACGNSGVVLLDTRNDKFSELSRIDTGPTLSCAFTRDGHTLVVAGQDAVVQAWDIADPQRPEAMPQLTGLIGSATSVDVTDNGRTAVAADTEGNTILWDLDPPVKPSLIASVPTKGNTETPVKVVFAPDGRTMITGNDFEIQAWDISKPAKVRPIGTPRPTRGVLSMTVAGNGRTLAVAHMGSATLWDLTDPVNITLLATIPAPGESSETGLRAASIAASGSTFALTVGSGIALWDISDPTKARQTAVLPVSGSYEMMFIEDRELLLTAQRTGPANEMTVWEISNPAEVRKLSTSIIGHLLGVTPDSRTVITTVMDEFSGSAVTLWDIADPAYPTSTAAPRRFDNHLTAVDFSDDQALAVLGSAATSAIFVDTTDLVSFGELDITLPRQGATVSAEFVPGGDSLVTTNTEEPLLLWDMTGLNSLLADPLDMACAMVGSGFNQDEWNLRVPGIPYLDSCPHD